jgi:hypothetical protein
MVNEKRNNRFNLVQLMITMMEVNEWLQAGCTRLWWREVKSPSSPG